LQQDTVDRDDMHTYFLLCTSVVYLYYNNNCFTLWRSYFLHFTRYCSNIMWGGWVYNFLMWNFFWYTKNYWNWLSFNQVIQNIKRERFYKHSIYYIYVIGIITAVHCWWECQWMAYVA